MYAPPARPSGRGLRSRGGCTAAVGGADGGGPLGRVPPFCGRRRSSEGELFCLRRGFSRSSRSLLRERLLLRCLKSLLSLDRDLEREVDRELLLWRRRLSLLSLLELQEKQNVGEHISHELYDLLRGNTCRV